MHNLQKQREKSKKAVEKKGNMCYNKYTKTRMVKSMNASALCAVPIGYVCDGVILLGLFIFMMICRKRGFIKMFFRFASGLLALVAAVSLAKFALSATGGLFGLQEYFTGSFTETFSKMSGFDVDISGQDVGALLASGDLSAVIATLIAKKYVGVELAAGTTLGYLAGSTVAELLCTLLSGVALFFAIKIVCKLLGKIFTVLINRIKLLGKVNRMLGMIVGFLEGVFFISLAVSVLTLLPSAAILDFFNSSIILRLLYNHNPIVWLLGMFL